MTASEVRRLSFGVPFRFELLAPELRRKPPSPDAQFVFGTIATNHMVTCDYSHSEGRWQEPVVTAFAPFTLRPDSLVFHYGQQIFEGLKAYQDARKASGILLFRPELNAKRFHNSATRLGMQAVPEELFLAAIKTLVTVESEWLLPRPATLYIRPFLIPLDYGVSYRAAQDYRFCVILSPAKNYFAKDKGVSVAVERQYVRAVRGGVGETKCGGNYAAAVSSLSKSRKLGADQVLWLDAIEMRYIEEVGAMNIMFVQRDGSIITPPLGGSILAGVTRHSVIEWCQYKGIKVHERRIAIDDCLKKIQEGEITEAFGCGTAAVVSPITTLIDGEQSITVGNSQPGKLTNRLREDLEAIQFGLAEDVLAWTQRLDKVN